MDTSQNPLSQINDFELQHFIHNPNFDQFGNIIRADQIDCPIPEFHFDPANPCFVGQNQFDSAPVDLFSEFNDTRGTMTSFVVDADSNFGESNNAVDSLPSYDGASMDFRDEDDYLDGADSSETTNANPMKKRKVDRSRTLISERRRRGRMKEKLYALRSLVPNITKMDKASIVGDAVAYVQDLQSQAKKLKAEISGLEASLLDAERYQESIQTTKRIQMARRDSIPISRKIIQLDVFQVEEKGFYVRVVCNKGQGVAASLYRALESLTNFHVQNSNLNTTSDTFLLTFTLHGTDYEQSFNLPDVKPWIMSCFLNQGFEFVSPLPS